MDDEPTQVFRPIAPEPPRPPSRPKTPWVVAAVAFALALILGVVAAWAYQREDPAVAGLRADLDQTHADLADTQAQLDKAKASAGESSQQLTVLQAQVAKLRKKLKNSVADSKLPVVVYERAGLGDQALFDSFQTHLVDPMTAWYEQQGLPPIVAVVIEIPEKEHDPYSYVAVGLEGGSESALFGERGDPLPTWAPPCSGSECSGLD